MHITLLACWGKFINIELTMQCKPYCDTCLKLSINNGTKDKL